MKGWCNSSCAGNRRCSLESIHLWGERREREGGGRGRGRGRGREKGEGGGWGETINLSWHSILGTYWAHTGHSLGTHWALTGHTLGTHWAHTGHSLGTHWALTGHTLGTHWALTGHTLGTHWAHTGHSLGTHWALTGHTLGIHWAHTRHSLGKEVPEHRREVFWNSWRIIHFEFPSGQTQQNHPLKTPQSLTVHTNLPQHHFPRLYQSKDVSLFASSQIHGACRPHLHDSFVISGRCRH